MLFESSDDIAEKEALLCLRVIHTTGLMVANRSVTATVSVLYTYSYQVLNVCAFRHHGAISNATSSKLMSLASELRRLAVKIGRNQ